MPHIIVKLYAGRSETQKKELTEKIVKNLMDVTDCSETAVSVAFEEFEPEEWAQAVYQKDIIDGPGKLYKTPGYNPFTKKEEKKTEGRADLTAYVRGACEQAAKESTDALFNPMSWLDLELEDNPQSFDPFFGTPWDELSDDKKGDRMMAVRRKL